MTLGLLLSIALAGEFIVPSTAYPTVQDAVGDAGDGDTIIVTESVAGSIDVNDKDLVINGVGLDVVLTAGSGPVLAIRGDSDASVRHLTIDGEDARQAVRIYNEATVTLDAVKIMRGVEEGGGLETEDTSVVVITGSLVCGCDAPSGGDNGGGLRTKDDSDVELVASVFFANDANARGGAVRIEEAGSITACTFYDNTANRSAAVSASDTDGTSRDIDLVDNIIWANSNRISKKNPAVVDRASNSHFVGGGNVYYDNDPADTDSVLPGDTFGTDPQLLTTTPDCLTATMADFTALTGGFADTNGLGAVGADGDLDGYGTGPDCDDVDPLIHPEATELPADGVDQNCDGVELCYVDADEDGHGDMVAPPIWTTDTTCSEPGFASVADDCDDNDASVYGGASEIVDDGVDQDCFAGDACFQDGDGDGYTTGMVIPSQDLDCDDAGEATDGTPSGDCNDADPMVNPGVGVDITGDGIDSDCDDNELCYVDADNDGFSDIDQTVTSTTGDCTGPGEGLDSLDDCDDGDVNTFPGAPEQCDLVDNDCDAIVDEDVVPTDWYPDADEDGFGDDVAPPVNDCIAPTGHVSVAGDCDDDAADINPGFPEIPCDGVDNDCSSATLDDDGSCGGDTGDTGDTGFISTDADTDTDTDTDTDVDTDTDSDVDTDTDTTGNPLDDDPASVAQDGCGCSEARPRSWSVGWALTRRR